MKVLFFCLTASIALAGCASKTGSSVSTIQGSLELSTFPGTPTGVAAFNESGGSIQTSLDANAGFVLHLEKDHTYHLAVSGADLASLPLVFRRTSGQLDTTFHVSGGGAAVQLGSVRYMALASLDMGDDAGQVTCEEEEEEEEGAEAEDGECENGIDTTTGAACIDPPDETENETADPNQPMATPEHNVPDDVGGCDEVEEED